MQFATNKMSCSMRYRRKGQLHLWSKSSVIKKHKRSSILLSFKTFFPFSEAIASVYNSLKLTASAPNFKLLFKSFSTGFYDWTKPPGILIFTTIVSIFMPMYPTSRPYAHTF